MNKTIGYRLYNKLMRNDMTSFASFVYNTTVRENPNIKMLSNGLYQHSYNSQLFLNEHPLNELNKYFQLAKSIYFFKYCPKKGDVCIDIGAGVGIETVLMSYLCGNSGQVFSVEASEKTYGILTENIKLNQLSNVKVLQIAISDKDGEVEITEDIGIANTINSNVNDKGVSKVPGLTMDHFLEREKITHIDYLKVNIEGAEKLLIQNYKGIQFTKHVAISCHDFLAERGGDKWFYSKKEVLAFLKANNFKLFHKNTGTDYIDDWIYGVNQSYTK